MCVWRAMEKVRWVDKVGDGEVLRRIGEERRVLTVSYTHLDVYKRQELGH